jgi:hypothetical protein
MRNSEAFGLKVGDLIMWNKMAPGRRDLHACGLITENHGDGHISVLIENQTFDVSWNQVILVIPPSDQIRGVVCEA